MIRFVFYEGTSRRIGWEFEVREDEGSFGDDSWKVEAVKMDWNPRMVPIFLWKGRI